MFSTLTNSKVITRTMNADRINRNKLLVIGSVNLVAVSCGFTYGHMTGMIRALQKRDEGIAMSDNELSLIASFVTVSCALGVMCIIVSDTLGRRWSFILFSVPLMLNWITLYYARTFATFILSRFFAGVATGVFSTLNLIAVAEYMSPKSRAILMSMVSMVAPAFGNVIGHLLGVNIHWRTLALVGLVFAIVHLILPYFWPESPHWLASRGRFEDCERAFRKLHGNTRSANEELKTLLKMESNKQMISKEMNINNHFKKLSVVFKKRYFWDLMITSCFIYIYYAAAGRVVISSLATVVLEEITGSSDILLFTLLVDAFIFTGTCVSCVLIKKSSIRLLLFTSGCLANAILLILSACLYFKNAEVYYQWINVVLLACYFIIVNAGPYPVIEILLGEIFPIDIKMCCFLLGSPIVAATISSSILFLPHLLSVMGYHGLFLLNSGIMSVCLVYFYIRLPETKGKTLQEIEVYFKTKSFDVEEVLTNNDQIMTLI